MIKCPKCGNEISEKSTNCIYCGLTRNMIDQEIQIKKLSLNKEININVGKNKKLVIVMEIFMLVIFITYYATVYIPKILEILKQEKIRKDVVNCEENYNGTWNFNESQCETEFGVIYID